MRLFLWCSEDFTNLSYTQLIIFTDLIEVMRLLLQHLTRQHSRKFVFMYCFLFSITLGACSGSETNSNKVGSSAAKSSKNLKPHIHPENACLGARTHSHVGGEKQHEHSFKCESTNINTNAHIHPAKGNYPEMRHVHPNGSNEHSHY